MGNRKVHITLVGGQPAPVYHGIVAIKPDLIVYIYSTSSIKALESLKEVVKIPFVTHELGPTDPSEIQGLARKLKEEYAEDEITLNISSGLKSWSHLFGYEFQNAPNAAVVYMDQNNVLWNYNTMDSSSDFEFNMHSIFRLYGNPLDNNYTRYSDYTESDKACIKKIEEIRKFDFNTFNKLTVSLDKAQKHTLQQSPFGSFYAGESFIEWEKATPTTPGFARIHVYKKKREMEVTLESPNIISILFHSGWFELKVANLMNDWDKSKEICMNCRFPSKKNADKNECDVIVNSGTKILFVECKTQICKVNDIDKFRSVVKNYGGTGSKGLFITQSPMTDLAREKCKEHNILAFSLDDPHPHGVAKELYELLDSELFNINEK